MASEQTKDQKHITACWEPYRSEVLLSSTNLKCSLKTSDFEVGFLFLFCFIFKPFNYFAF